MMKYKKTIFGFSFLALLLLVSVLYPHFGPKDYNRDFLQYDKNGKLLGMEFKYDQNGKFKGLPPYPPSKEHIMGTDRNGADILLILIAGAKVTLLTTLVITILRVVIGGALGIFLTLWIPKLLFLVKDFFFVFRFIPVIIMAYFLMGPIALEYTGISIIEIIQYQIAILAIIGIPSVFLMSSEIVEELKGKTFIQSSYLMGASHWHILKKQLKPYVKSYGLLIFVQQFLITLVVIMHLGTFNFFIGGPAASGEFLTNNSVKVSLTMEWSGLIGQNYREFYVAPWVVLGPLLGFLLVIVVVNMMKKEIESSLDIELVSLTKKKRKSRKKEMERNNIKVPVQQDLELLKG